MFMFCALMASTSLMAQDNKTAETKTEKTCCTKDGKKDKASCKKDKTEKKGSCCKKDKTECKSSESK